MVDWGRRFPRPLALAHTRLELPFAAVSVLVLLALFLGDLWEPPRIVVGVLDLFPILAAVWLASGRIAALVCATGFGLLALTGLTGVVDWHTVAAEVATYLVIAVVARIYARSLVDLLEVRRRRTKPGQPTDQGVTLASLSDEPPTGLTALSQREREVASLAAQGFTAREIGKRLFWRKNRRDPPRSRIREARNKLKARADPDRVKARVSPGEARPAQYARGMMRRAERLVGDRETWGAEWRGASGRPGQAYGPGGEPCE